MTKITKATFKSFVKKNRANILINVKSSFDGMVDGCVSHDGGFVKASDADFIHENNLGIQGVWLVGGSRDYFTAFEKNGLKGIEVSNCCGRFIVATK